MGAHDKKVKKYSISWYPLPRAMPFPLSTEYPAAGELIFNSVARSPGEMPYSFTAQYHKLFSFTYITYFFTSVPIPRPIPLLSYHKFS
jgi:hypothetical protein